jgi:hypothetical protein
VRRLPDRCEFHARRQSKLSTVPLASRRHGTESLTAFSYPERLDASVPRSLPSARSDLLTASFVYAKTLQRDDPAFASQRGRFRRDVEHRNLVASQRCSKHLLR